jgi:cell division protein FtsB
MIQNFSIQNFINFFLIFISSILIFNIFFGDKNIFELNENQKIIEILNNDYDVLLKKKEKLNFYLSLYDSGNRDFIETLIRKELNFKGNKEQVFIYD